MGLLNLTEAATHLGLIGPRVEPPPPRPLRWTIILTAAGLQLL